MRMLATLEDVYAVLGQSPADPTNVKLLNKLEMASDRVRRHTGQVFDFMRDDVAWLDGTGTRSLQLPQRPVEDVTLIENLDTAGNVIPPSGTMVWRLDASAGLLYRVDGGRWDIGSMNWRVTYSHGYLVPGQTAPIDLTVPELDALVRETVAQMAAEMYTVDPAGVVDNEHIGNYSVGYSVSGDSGKKFEYDLEALNCYGVRDAA